MRTLNRKSEKDRKIDFDPHITEEKHNKYKKQFENIKKQIPFLSDEVARLALLGDFSENVEYQIAKRKLRSTNNKKMKIDFILNNSKIIKINKNSDRVKIGNTVLLKINNKIKTYKILGSQESDPSKNIISHNSPLAQILLNKKVDDKIELKLKDKIIKYKIIKID